MNPTSAVDTGNPSHSAAAGRTRTRVARRTHQVSATLITVMGVIHVLATPQATASNSRLESMWFAGQGLAVVFISLMNWMMALSAPRRRTPRVILHVANVGYLAYMAALTWASPQPPIVVGTVLALLVALTAVSIPNSAEE